MRRILFVSLVLVLPLAAVAEPFREPLQKTCAQLQSDGWAPPIDPQTNKPGKAEMNLPRGLYLCTLTHALPAGPGHAPDLQALLSNTGKGPVIVLSANIWCAADRTATFDALLKQVERLVGSVPEAVSSAIRAGKDAKATGNGLSFEVRPVPVDSGACESVPAGQLGPVLLELGVQVKPAK